MMNREERRAAKSQQKGHSKPPVMRKVWPTNIDTIQYAIDGASIISQGKRDQLSLKELSSLDAFLHGRASLQEWYDLATLNNITLTMVNMGIGAEALADCHAAESGLIESAERFERTGKMGMSGPAISAMREVIEWHDAQRSSISRSRYEEALRLTMARVKNGHQTIDLNKLMQEANA